MEIKIKGKKMSLGIFIGSVILFLAVVAIVLTVQSFILMYLLNVLLTKFQLPLLEMKEAYCLSLLFTLFRLPSVIKEQTK